MTPKQAAFEALEEAPERPHRHIVFKAEIGADSWDALQGELRELATRIAIDGRLSGSSVSGSPSAGHVITCEIDETMDHDRYFELNEAYCKWLRDRPLAKDSRDE